MMSAKLSNMRLAKDGDKPIPKRFPFTADSLARLTIANGKAELWVWDTKTPGLAFRLMPSGSGSFFLYRRVNGRPQKLRLGGRELTVEQARRKAQEYNGEIAKDNDPGALRRATRKSETLRQLFDRYWSEHLIPRCTEKTRITDKSRFETCLDTISSKRVMSISETDVRSLHVWLGREVGQISANRAIQLLRRLYSFARIGRNPAAKSVDMFRETKRERFVQPDELPRLFKALDAEDINPLIRDFLYVSLYTGARRANVCAMRMEQINLASATWTIPASSSKNKKDMTITLAEPALEIIRRRWNDKSGFIFPSDSRSGHFTTPTWTWRKILARAGLEDLRLHDLRRTFGSFQAAMGASLPIIGKSLGHANPSSTAVYSRLHLDAVRASVTGAVNAMIAASKVTVNP